jgi:hypothetical protein
MHRWMDIDCAVSARPGIVSRRNLIESKRNRFGATERRLVDLLRGPENGLFSAAKRQFFSIYWENQTMLLEHYLTRILLAHASQHATKSDAAGDIASIVRRSPDEPTLLRRVFRWFHNKTDGKEQFLKRCPCPDNVLPVEGGVGPDDEPPARRPRRPRPRAAETVSDETAAGPGPPTEPRFTGAPASSFAAGTTERDTSSSWMCRTDPPSCPPSTCARRAVDPRTQSTTRCICFTAPLLRETVWGILANKPPQKPETETMRTYWCQQTGREWPDPHRKYVEQLYQCIQQIMLAVITDGSRSSPSVLQRILRFLRGAAKDDCAAAYRRRFDHSTNHVVRQLVLFLTKTQAERSHDATVTVESVVQSIFSTTFALYEMADEVVGVGWMEERDTLEYVNDLKNQAELDRRAMFEDLERRMVPWYVVDTALKLLLEACDVVMYDACDWEYPAGDEEPYTMQYFDSHAARQSSEDMKRRIKDLQRPHIDAVRFLRYLRSATEEVCNWMKVDRRDIRDFVAKSPVTTMYNLQSRPDGGAQRPDVPRRPRPAAERMGSAE